MKHLLLAILLSGCASMVRVNDCLVTAVSHSAAVSAKNQLEGKTAFNEVLLVSFTDTPAGHALSIFEHRSTLWSYDVERGSQQIAKGTTITPYQAAWTIYPSWRVKKAFWMGL